MHFLKKLYYARHAILGFNAPQDGSRNIALASFVFSIAMHLSVIRSSLTVIKVKIFHSRCMI